MIPITKIHEVQTTLLELLDLETRYILDEEDGQLLAINVAEFILDDDLLSMLHAIINDKIGKAGEYSLIYSESAFGVNAGEVQAHDYFKLLSERTDKIKRFKAIPPPPQVDLSISTRTRKVSMKTIMLKDQKIQGHDECVDCYYDMAMVY